MDRRKIFVVHQQMVDKFCCITKDNEVKLMPASLVSGLLSSRNLRRTFQSNGTGFERGTAYA